jgi:hypothetical protein
MQMLEKMSELVRNLLHKTPTVAVKAIVVSGDYVPQLVESADQIVKTIREEFDGQLDMVEHTKNQLVNFLLIRFKEERVNMKRAAISTIQVFVSVNFGFLALKNSGKRPL